jgi:DNA-binding MarR family transcriptional regulator
MAIYRSVHVSFWTDTKIAVEFTPRERYFYLYLLTNPHTSLAGCYEISVKQIAAETGIARAEAEKLLERLEKVHKVLEYDPDTREVFILRWHAYNWNRSPNCRKAIEASLGEIKNASFAERIRELARGLQAPSRAAVADSVSVSGSDSGPTLEEYRRMQRYIEN